MIEIIGLGMISALVWVLVADSDAEQRCRASTGSTPQSETFVRPASSMKHAAQIEEVNSAVDMDLSVGGSPLSASV